MDSLLISENSEQRISYDIDQIHELATQLLPFSKDIQHDNTHLPEPRINAQLQMLVGILHELHPADVADILENLPQKNAL